MFAMLNVSAMMLIAQMPGQNITPQAPAGFGEKINQGLNFAFYSWHKSKSG